MVLRCFRRDRRFSNYRHKLEKRGKEKDSASSHSMERVEVKKALKIRFSERTWLQGGRDRAYYTPQGHTGAPRTGWRSSKGCGCGMSGVSREEHAKAQRGGITGSMHARLCPLQCTERNTHSVFPPSRRCIHSMSVFFQAWFLFGFLSQPPLPKLSSARLSL